MLVNIYQSKTPISVFTLPVFIAMVCSPILFLDAPTESYPISWQNNLWTIIDQSTLLNFVLSTAIIAVSAHQLNNVYNRNSFYSKATFLPGLIYVLCIFSMGIIHFTPEILGHLFVIIGLGQLLKLRRQDPAKAIIFSSSVMFGLAAVLTPLHIGLIILPWLALSIFRPFVWREWFMVLIGMILPIIYYLSFEYLSLNKLEFLKIPDNSHLNGLTDDFFNWISLGIFGLIVIGSLFKYLQISRTEINRFKLQSQVVFHLLWLSIAAFVLAWIFYNTYYLYAAIPLGIFIATSILHSRSTQVMNIILLLWLIISTSNLFF